MTFHPRVEPTSDEEEQLLDEYAIDQQSSGLSPRTIEYRRRILNAFVRRTGVSLLTATARDLKLDIGRDGIAPGSRRIYQTTVRGFYRFLQDEGFRDDNPAERLRTVRVPRRQPRPFTREQINAMLTTGAYAKTRAAIHLSYHQGFRVSQVARMHGRDIDHDERVIRTVAKGSKERVLPLHPVIAELAKQMPRDDWWFPARARGGHPDGHVWPASISQLISRAKERAGIEDDTLTAHSLRHAFATHLVEENVNLRVVQELMLHEDIATTQLYTAVSDTQRRLGMSALAGLSMPDHSGRPASGRHAQRAAVPA